MHLFCNSAANWVGKQCCAFTSHESNLFCNKSAGCCRFRKVLVLSIFFTLFYVIWWLQSPTKPDKVVWSEYLSTALNHTLLFFKGQTGPRGNRGESGGQGSMVSRLSRKQLPQQGSIVTMTLSKCLSKILLFYFLFTGVERWARWRRIPRKRGKVTAFKRRTLWLKMFPSWCLSIK